MEQLNPHVATIGIFQLAMMHHRYKICIVKTLPHNETQNAVFLAQKTGLV